MEVKIEQKANNTYVKAPNKIEGHMLKVLERYFETNPEAISSSREGIINETIRRMRQESISSVQSIVVDEVTKYIDILFAKALEDRLGKFVKELHDEIAEIKQSSIKKEIYTIEIEEPTNEILLPADSNIDADRDLILVHINGQLYIDHAYETYDDNTIKKIVFNDTLIKEDIVTINCVVISTTEV